MIKSSEMGKINYSLIKLSSKVTEVLLTTNGRSLNHTGGQKCHYELCFVSVIFLVTIIVWVLCLL